MSSGIPTSVGDNDTVKSALVFLIYDNGISLVVQNLKITRFILYFFS